MQKPLAVRGAISLVGIPDLALAIMRAICGTAAGEPIGGRQPQHVRRLADALRALTPLGVPHLHIHGEQDDIVPSAASCAMPPTR